MSDQAIGTLKKREGTTDLGKDYEHVYLVYLSIKLMEDGNVENFFLSSNNEKYGDFDDVVIEIQHENKVDTYAIQLKHKEKEKKSLTQLMLMKDYSPEKYFKSYCKDLKNLSPPVQMILFTNVKLHEVSDTIPLKLNEVNVEVNVIKQKQNKFITTSVENRNCYIFELDNRNSKNNNTNDNIPDDFKEYLKHFYLYSDQLNVTELKARSLEMFQNLFKSDESAFNNFVAFITEWSKIDKKKIKLSKIFLQRVIALCVLTPFIKPLKISGKDKPCRNAVTLREIISKFCITHLNEDNYNIIKSLWSNVLDELQDLCQVNKELNIYQLDINQISSKEELENVSVEISKLLWILGKCPLVVKGCPQVYQVMQICQQGKFIILDSEENFNKGISQLQDKTFVLNSLYDLRNDVQIYEDVMNNFTYSLEGQKEESLKNLFEINEEFMSKITVDKLVQMLNNPLLIGKQKEVLPPSHIQRTLTRILIDVEFLKNFCSDSVIIVSCVTNFDFLKIKLEHTDIIILEDAETINWDHLENKRNDKLVYISENEISEKVVKTLCSKNSRKTIHHLRYFSESCFEWISSQRKGPSPVTQKEHDCFHELGKFRVESEGNKNSIREFDLFNDTCNNVNIICANPGMGKTSLMKSLKNSSSSRLWTILIYSRGHSSFFQNENINAANFMQYIYDEVTKQYYEDIEVNVFKALWKKKQVQLIWDGLDEASDQSFEAILDIVNDISKKDIKQWLTARINLRNRLEEKFQVFSRNLNKFNEDEQKQYVKDRLKISDSDKFNKTFRIIDTNIRSFSNNSILEIPLQIYMLTELLVRDRDNYYLNLLKTTFTILDLYQHFVEEKFKVYYEEKLKQDLSIEYNQKKYAEEKNSKIEVFKTVAYKLHFPNVFKKIFSAIFNTKDVIYEIKQSGDPVGFIISGNRLDNDDLEFVHNSFGEYFAALYLFDTKKSKARNRKFISNSRFNNIRFFLDLMLCGKSKAFVAVLYQNSQLLRECIDKDLLEKDGIGRDVLELSCTWSKQYPLIKIDEFKFNKIKRLTTNEVNDLQYKVISKKFHEIENTIPFSLKKILICLPFLIPFSQGIGFSFMQLFNFNVLYYTIKFDLEIIFDCFQNSDSLANAYHNINITDYLLMVLRCNSQRILEKIMKDPKYQNVIIESLTILLEENDSDNLPFITSLFQLSYASSLLLYPLIFQNFDLNVIRLILNQLSKSDVNLNVPDSNGLMPIHYACKNKGKYALGIVQLLINSKINLDVPDSNGSLPIHYACRNEGDDASEIVQLLINSNSKLDIPDSNGLLPIHYAIEKNWIEVIKNLINLNVNLDVPDSNGLLPIHYACQRGWIQIIKHLIHLNIKLDVPDSNGLMPIHYACRNEGWNAPKIVELLVNSKIKLDVPDSNGLMPIHYVCQNKGEYAFEIVQLLINSKINVGVPDSNGSMPIHYACQNEGRYAPEIVQLLIHSNIKLDVPDSNGLLPIDYARRNKLRGLRIFQMLKKSNFNIFTDATVVAD